MIAALILIIQTFTPDGHVLGVNFQYDIPPERCEQLALAHTNMVGEFRTLARCFEVEPPIQELLAPVEEA